MRSQTRRLTAATRGPHRRLTVCARLQLTGATPVVELVAIRILELVRDGEFDTDRLTDATVATFER